MNAESQPMKQVCSPWTPPSNIDAEKALLGAIFANPMAYENVADRLLPEHFYLPLHGLVYAEAKRLIDQGSIANPVTMKTFFEGPDFQDVGGIDYSLELAQSMVSITNAKEYGKLIHETFLQRELSGLGQEVAARAAKEDPETVIESLEQTLTALVGDSHKEASTGVQVDEALHHIEAAMRGEITGLEIGLIDLDNMLGGLQPEDLIIIAGATSMGKTVLGVGLAEAGAKVGPTLFCSLEMSAKQIHLRRIAAKAQIDHDRLRRGKRHRTPLGQPELDKAIRVGQELKNNQLIIDDRGGISVSYLRRKARHLMRTEGLVLIVVDYLQLMSGEGENRTNEVASITRGLKALAKELGIPIVALSQLSRAVDAREGNVPRLSDLRESGSIEQDADVVGFVFREEYYLEKAKPVQGVNETAEKFGQKQDAYLSRLAKVKGIAEIILPKNRHGQTGTVPVKFVGAYQRFENLQRQEDLYDA
ncbi:MAG: replicative DNA helicase [Gammaproteobacteria bacterium]|nr:replicative DNA helicase [Gammaproteobacteria bacterium]